MIFIPEKFIVHEWGTFRWGVFNEYPDDGENQFYFSTVFGRPDPVRCSVGLLGRIMARYPNHTTAVCNPSNPKFQDPATGLLDPYCKYYMYPYHNRGFESMMDHQWAKEVRYYLFHFPTFLLFHLLISRFNIYLYFQSGFRVN